MIEIGIKSDILEQITYGQKTIEVRLGTPEFLTLAAGDTIIVRDDTITKSHPTKTRLIVTQVLLFESFAELFEAVDYEQAVPSATSLEEAMQTYRQFYSPEDEVTYGVAAIYFTLDKPTVSPTI